MVTLGIINAEGARSLNGSMIPRESDLAKVYGYRPVMTGWIIGDRLYDRRDGLSGALACSGVGCALGADEASMSTREKIGLGLGILSTAAIVIIAVATVARK